jgi:hypothetical protein
MKGPDPLSGLRVQTTSEGSSPERARLSGEAPKDESMDEA